MRHRVGDGRTVQVWSNKWIPSYEDGKVKMIRKQDCNVEKLEELIREDEWNQDLINKWFMKVDVQNILAIPLSLIGGRDRVCWKYSKSRQFTVKSAYAAEMEEVGEYQREEEEKIGKAPTIPQ